MPEFIGKVLMQDFFKRLGNSTAEKVTLNSELNSEKFYFKLGFITVNHIETSIKNRFMPVMELKINEVNNLNF